MTIASAAILSALLAALSTSMNTRAPTTGATIGVSESLDVGTTGDSQSPGTLGAQRPVDPTRSPTLTAYLLHSARGRTPLGAELRCDLAGSEFADPNLGYHREATSP